MSRKLLTLLLVLAMIAVPTGILLARGGGRRGGGRAGRRSSARRGRHRNRSNKNRQSRQDVAANREMNRIEERVTLLESALAERGR